MVDTYHGVKVVDPYRWLEDGSYARRCAAWSDAENAYARDVLDALPPAPELRRRIGADLRRPSRCELPRLPARAAAPLFAFAAQPPKQQPLLVFMTSPDRPVDGRVVVDPNALDPKAYGIDWFVPSLDGSLAAVSLSEGGSEAGDVHVYQATDGKDPVEDRPACNGGTAGGSAGLGR